MNSFYPPERFWAQEQIALLGSSWGAEVAIYGALDVLEVHLNLILTLQCCLDWRQSNRASRNSRCCVTVLHSVVRLKGLSSSALLKNSYSVLWSLSRMYFWILDRVMHVSTLQAVALAYSWSSANWEVGGLIPRCSNLHAKASAGKILKPQLLLMHSLCVSLWMLDCVFEWVCVNRGMTHIWALKYWRKAPFTALTFVRFIARLWH